MTTLKKMVYLANAYSSKLDDKAAANFEKLNRRNLEAYVGGLLRKQYNHCFILPIALSGAMADLHTFNTGFAEWESDDFTLISKCDEVWVLMTDGWDISVGVRAEIEFAEDNDIPIYYLSYPGLMLTKRKRFSLGSNL